MREEVLGSGGGRGRACVLTYVSVSVLRACVCGFVRLCLSVGVFVCVSESVFSAVSSIR